MTPEQMTELSARMWKHLGDEIEAMHLRGDKQTKWGILTSLMGTLLSFAGTASGEALCPNGVFNFVQKAAGRHLSDRCTCAAHHVPRSVPVGQA